MSIPLNNIVKINPGVLDVGNNGNNLFGLMLTKQEVLPANQITTFANTEQVGKVFGQDSTEYKLANVYFSGFTNSDRVAEQLYIAPYYADSVPFSIVGGALGALTLDELRLYSGDLSFSIADTLYRALDVDLSVTTSFSDAASILNSLIVDVYGNAAPVYVTFSVATGSMVITVKNAGDKIENVSGTLAEDLLLVDGKTLTEKESVVATHSVISTEKDEGSMIVGLLNTLREQNISFCSVFLAWDLNELKEAEISDKDINNDKQLKLALAKWANSMKDDVCVILNDSGKDNLALDDSTLNKSDIEDEHLSFAEIVQKRKYEGVVSVYNNLELCAFIAGYPAAWDLTKTDGRFTAAFRRNSLLEANVFNENNALTLKAKGYNFYGSWASATSNFTFMYEGKISGQYLWLDSWFCQVWMRRQLQYYFVLTLLSKGQIPYNTDGKGILTTAIKPAIDQYMNFGAIRPGISLSDKQIQELKQAGLNQSQINNITTVGYYLKVDMASVTPQTRVKRGSPPINFWYTDGQSVQQINMNSIEIQ